jgi:hypothetical protein
MVPHARNAGRRLHMARKHCGKVRARLSTARVRQNQPAGEGQEIAPEAFEIMEFAPRKRRLRPPSGAGPILRL